MVADTVLHGVTMSKQETVLSNDCFQSLSTAESRSACVSSELIWIESLCAGFGLLLMFMQVVLSSGAGIFQRRPLPSV